MKLNVFVLYSKLQRKSTWNRNRLTCATRLDLMCCLRFVIELYSTVQYSAALLFGAVNCQTQQRSSAQSKANDKGEYNMSGAERGDKTKGLKHEMIC